MKAILGVFALGAADALARTWAVAIFFGLFLIAVIGGLVGDSHGWTLAATVLSLAVAWSLVIVAVVGPFFGDGGPLNVLWLPLTVAIALIAGSLMTVPLAFIGNSACERGDTTAAKGISYVPVWYGIREGVEHGWLPDKGGVPTGSCSEL